MDRDKTLEWVALVVVIVGAIALGYMFNWLIGLAVLVVLGAVIASRLWQRAEPPGPAE